MSAEQTFATAWVRWLTGALPIATWNPFGTAKLVRTDLR